MIPRLLLVLALTLAPFAIAADQSLPPPTKILFIGNSYTHANNIPGIIEALAKANGRALAITVHLPGGRTWEKHWQEGTAQTLIQKGDWDIIVLQNQSYEPVGDPATMLAYAQCFGDLIKTTAPHARIILYNTWAYRDLNSPAGHQKKYPASIPPKTSQEMQARLNAAYRAAAEAIDAEIAPVGQAWELALTDRPTLTLHGDDGSHPTRLGAYLAAMTLYATLFQTPAHIHPATLTLPSRAGDADAKPMTLTISAEDRDFFATQVTRALAAIAPRPLVECP